MSRPLKLRRIAIDTYHENVAFLHRECPLYRTEGFQALNKIEVRSTRDADPMIAVLNVVDDAALTAPDELGLAEESFARFGHPDGSDVWIDHASPPRSLRAVRSKIAGARLEGPDFLAICKDVLRGRYSRIEIAAFLVACAQGGLERDEVHHLTRAMVETGRRLDWGEPVVVDKHCIGGVPGNRTSMIVVPIVAAHGLLVPKTSSRAITSPAGTADTMEMLARVDLAPEALQAIVRAERGFIAWGGTAELAPVDDLLIVVERALSMDSPGQMVASILAKKIAAGSTHLLVDIPVGPSAKIRSQREALRLRKLFEYVGDRTGLHLEVAITDGAQPVGRGIGPALEARDALQVLRNDPDAPQDLREKALALAGRMLEFDPDVRGGRGYTLARDLLESGRALEKLQRIATAQGPSPVPEREAPLRVPVRAGLSGTVGAMDNLQLARIARLAGAPMDRHAGIELHRKLGDRVAVGDALYTIHAEFRPDLQFAVRAAHGHTGYTIAVTARDDPSGRAAPTHRASAPGLRAPGAGGTRAPQAPSD